MNRSCLAVLFLATAAWSAEPPKFSTPEPDFPPDDLRAPGPDDKPYPLPQDAALSKKLLERRRKFAREQFVAPYEASPAASAKGGAEGKAALEAFAESFVLPRFAPWTTSVSDRRTDALKAAVKAGCEDPVVRYLNTIHSGLGEIAIENAETLAELDADLAKAKATLIVRISCKTEHADWLLKANTTKAKKDARKVFEEAIKLCGELAKDKDPVADAAVFRAAEKILKTYKLQGWKRETGFELVSEALSGGSEHLQKCVEARNLDSAAFDARGSASAAKTSDEQMAEFRTLLKSAAEAGEAAWKADHTSPIAPTIMIGICMGQGTKRSTMEEWFKRAMTADPDYFEACAGKAFYLQPKWQGSVPELLTFGRQCMRTKNYDANLPYVLLIAHKIVSNNALDSHIKMHDAAWADVREVYECALQIKPTDRELLCDYALRCEAVGHYKAAQQHLKAVNGKFWEPIFKNKAGFDAAVKRIDAKVKEQDKIK